MPLSGLGLDARNVAFPTSSPSSAILKDSAPRRSHEGTDRISLSWITDNNKSNTDVDPSFFPTVENIAKAENHGYLTPTGSALGPGAPVQLNHHASAQSDPVQQETTNLPGIDEDRLYAQQQLQDAREELLGMRFALRARRTALTGLRQSAGAAEGALLSHLRNIFRAQGIPMQEDLEKDYKSLVAMRNKLGASDVEYDEAEQKYNREEWRYTQKEGDFVESLADDGPSFEGSQRTKERLVEAESLTRFATGNEETQSRAVEDSAAQREISAILELARSASLPELQRSIGNIQSTKHDVSSMETSRLVPASLPDLTPKMDLGYRRRTPSFSNSESALSQSRRVWPEMAQRIESWVLDTVQSSPLKHERLRYDPSQKGLTNSSHTDFAQEKDFQIGVMAGSESSNTTLTARQLRPVSESRPQLHSDDPIRNTTSKETEPSKIHIIPTSNSTVPESLEPGTPSGTSVYCSCSCVARKKTEEATPVALPELAVCEPVKKASMTSYLMSGKGKSRWKPHGLVWRLADSPKRFVDLPRPPQIFLFRLDNMPHQDISSLESTKYPERLSASHIGTKAFSDTK